MKKKIFYCTKKNQYSHKYLVLTCNIEYFLTLNTYWSYGDKKITSNLLRFFIKKWCVGIAYFYSKPSSYFCSFSFCQKREQTSTHVNIVTSFKPL